MFECKIENTKYNILTLTQNESDFQIYDIQGLNPPKAQINVSKVAGIDGSKFNSSKLEERNIVIYIKLNGDVERNRIYLYTFFPTKEWCKFYYKTGCRDVYIEGYVETVEVTSFTNNEVMQVSILCPAPYFKGAAEIVDDISKSLPKFKFPFYINENAPIPFSTLDSSRVTDVYNNSETESGVIVEVDIRGAVNSLQIKNTQTGETISLIYTFIKNDKIIINTNKGEKSIKLVRNGVETNIFTALQKNSAFFQLSIGDNYFSYIVNGSTTDDDELVHIVFKHFTLYRGV